MGDLKSPLARVFPHLMGIFAGYSIAAGFCIRKLYSTREQERSVNKLLEEQYDKLQKIHREACVKLNEFEKERNKPSYSSFAYWTTAAVSSVLGIALTKANQMR